jgi:hypothetical protein
VIKELIDARVWAGIHYRTSDMQAKVAGQKVAHWLSKHYFLPTGSRDARRGPKGNGPENSEHGTATNDDDLFDCGMPLKQVWAGRIAAAQPFFAPWFLSARCPSCSRR